MADRITNSISAPDDPFWIELLEQLEIEKRRRIKKNIYVCLVLLQITEYL